MGCRGDTGGRRAPDAPPPRKGIARKNIVDGARPPPRRSVARSRDGPLARIPNGGAGGGRAGAYRFVRRTSGRTAVSGGCPSAIRIYPFSVPATPQPNGGVPSVVPEPVPVAVERPPVQYVLIDGVWGYRDLDGHFHRKPSEPMNGPETDPVKAAAIPGTAPTKTTPVTTPGLSVRRYAANLPNPPVRAIVITPSSAHEHGPAH
jgi:hypothetical protein